MCSRTLSTCSPAAARTSHLRRPTIAEPDVLFDASTYDGIRDGSITLAVRRWKRPTVRAGGTLQTAVGQLGIDTVEIVDEGSLGDDDARRAGFAGRVALLASLRPPDDARRLYRITFHRLGDDPRIAVRADEGDEADRAVMRARLARMDARSDNGPWTTDVLELIAQRPGVRSADLASELSVDQHVLKQRIRRLKSMGLTESLTVGYRLSPRGRRLLGSLR